MTSRRPKLNPIPGGLDIIRRCNQKIHDEWETRWRQTVINEENSFKRGHGVRYRRREVDDEESVVVDGRLVSREVIRRIVEEIRQMRVFEAGKHLTMRVIKARSHAYGVIGGHYDLDRATVKCIKKLYVDGGRSPDWDPSQQSKAPPRPALEELDGDVVNPSGSKKIAGDKLAEVLDMLLDGLSPKTVAHRLKLPVRRICDIKAFVDARSGEADAPVEVEAVGAALDDAHVSEDALGPADQVVVDVDA